MKTENKLDGGIETPTVSLSRGPAPTRTREGARGPVVELVELSLSDREREYAQLVQAEVGLAPTPPRIGWTCPAIDKAIRRVRRFAEGQERAELIALLEQVRSENIGMRKRLEHLEGRGC